MGEKQAKDYTLEEAATLLRKDTNRVDAETTEYITRQVGKILQRQHLKQEKTITVQFLGDNYDCGEWHLTKNAIKSLPESTVHRLEKDFPKLWKRVKEADPKGNEGNKGSSKQERSRLSV